MTAVLVKVVIDRFDGAQQQYVRGGGVFRPSLEFPDAADEMLVGRAAVPFAFRSGSLPFVMVIANDTAGPQQDDGSPGWSWVVEYDREVPGCPQGGSYWVLSTNGTTQRLSELAQSPVAQPGQRYVPLPDDPGTPGEVLVKTETGTEWEAAPASGVSSVNGDIGVVVLGASDVGAVPAAQSFALANNTYKALQEWTVTGQTDDPLPPFGLVTGSQTYSWPNPASPVETTRGPAFWWGYNPALLSTQIASSAHGAIGVSVFADAGDSWNPATGGHGMEVNVGFVGPNRSAATNAIQVGALDDSTNTVLTTFRCGNGKYTDNAGNPVVSQWQLADASGWNYLRGGPFTNIAANGPGIVMGAPVSASAMQYWLASNAGPMQVVWAANGALGNGGMSWTVQSASDTMAALFQGGTSATFGLTGNAGPSTLTVASHAGSAGVALLGTTTANMSAASTGGVAAMTLNGNGSNVSCQLTFQKGGVNKWIMEDSGGSSFFVTNNSGSPQLILTSGSNAAPNFDNATTTFLSKTVVNGSFAVNNGGTALATTATKGFLYIPTCAGTPTGTPVVIAGAVPLAWDTVNGQLNAYQAGAWTAVGGGGGGGVSSVTAADASVVVGGTASAPTLRTGTLDQLASLHPAAAAVAFNGQKASGLANGVASSDAATVGQLPSVTGLAPLASPAFTGNPTAPTQTAGNASTRLATTAYADGAVSTLAATLGTAATQPSSAFDPSGAASAAQAAAIAAAPVSWGAADQGLVSWTHDIAASAPGGSQPLTNAGRLYTMAMKLPAPATITNIELVLTAVGSGLTAGQCFAALYQGYGGALLGVTADQASNWATAGTNGRLSMPLAGGPVSAAAGILVVALWYNGTTGPSPWRSNGNSGTFNLGLAAAAARWGLADAGVTTTAPAVLGTVSASNLAAFWAAVS